MLQTIAGLSLTHIEVFRVRLMLIQTIVLLMMLLICLVLLLARGWDVFLRGPMPMHAAQQADETARPGRAWEAPRRHSAGGLRCLVRTAERTQLTRLHSGPAGAWTAR